MEKIYFNSFSDFYIYYLKEHENPFTKIFHFIGTIFVFILLYLFIVTLNYFYLLLLPVFGYGFAWISHFFIEKNKPATFKYPFYSLVGDFRMFFEILSGKIKLF
ncbi:MAG: hypothetical protein CMG26_04055 [Candidatus Marinimicrobia bacterium]|nr:hypothetical protein [Candidatus Neomarinimicrobiota bacterium]